MKILVYSDVHGNKYALDNLYKSKDYINADIKIFLGDAVSMCPYPNECLNSIFKSGDIFLMGNHDSYCAYGLPQDPYFKANKIAHISYIRKKVSTKNKSLLKQVPKDYLLELNNKKFYFCHYMWESERFVMDDPDEPNKPTKKSIKLFKDIEADYYFFGHNHSQTCFSDNGKYYTCVGSLGMNYPGNYVVVEIENDIVKIHKKKLNFDIKSLKHDMLKLNYPGASKYVKWFNDKNEQ